MREKLFTMRMSEDENARLEAVATHYGLNGAGVIRMLLKREHEAIVGAVLQPEDRQVLMSLPTDGTPMGRPAIARALSQSGGGPSPRGVGQSMARLLGLDLISRSGGSSFSLTIKGKALL